MENEQVTNAQPNFAIPSWREECSIHPVADLNLVSGGALRCLLSVGVRIADWTQKPGIVIGKEALRSSR